MTFFRSFNGVSPWQLSKLHLLGTLSQDFVYYYYYYCVQGQE